jgi:ATP-binding cassette subfamily C protein
VGYTVANVATDLRLQLIRALLATRWEYYLRQPVGALANSVASEAKRAAQGYLNAATIMSQLIQVAVYLTVAVFVSWKATLVSLVFGFFLFLVLGRLVRTSRKAGGKQTVLMHSLLARLTDSLHSVKPLKAMARENLADMMLQSDTRKLNKALRKEVFSKEALKALQEPILAGLIGIGLFAALVHWHVPLQSVLVLVFLLARVLSQMNKAQRQYQKMRINESAYWAIRATIDEAAERVEPALGSTVPTLKQGIAFKSVSFGYDETRVLANASLFIPARAMTAITGVSGAGKTTVSDLVTALLRPQEGDIWIDGTPLSEIDRQVWRSMIGYVPQDTFLLHDTILHNVTLGDPDLTEADAQRALRAAEIWGFVETLPDGMQSVVGERGGRMSGGQRQRIAIARALAHRPALLILDEATSALDEESEAAVCKTLLSLKGSLTILAISHKPMLVEHAERVYRLDQGQAKLVSERPLAGRLARA